MSQQASAISSQSTVVNAAIKYSEAFSVERIEKMVRRELAAEYKSERGELEKRIEELSSQRTNADPERVKKLLGLLSDQVSGLFSPLVRQYAIYLLSMSDEARTVEIDKIEVKETRELILNIVRVGKEIQSEANRKKDK